MALSEKEREQVEKLIESLKGTCQNLVMLAEDYDVDMDDADVCALIDQEIFECAGCGWWCERSEESIKAPGSCDECEPEEDDDGSDD